MPYLPKSEVGGAGRRKKKVKSKENCRGGWEGGCRGRGGLGGTDSRQTDLSQMHQKVPEYFIIITLPPFYSSSSASIQPLHPQSRLLSAGVGGVGVGGGAYYSGSY